MVVPRVTRKKKRKPQKKLKRAKIARKIRKKRKIQKKGVHPHKNTAYQYSAYKGQTAYQNLYPTYQHFTK